MFTVARGRPVLAIAGLLLMVASVAIGYRIGQPHTVVQRIDIWLAPWDNDARGGSRTFPPFQGNGGGPSGGPIMTLKSRDIDMFFHPTAVRPGTVLEVGDTFSIAGAVGPTLAASVSTTVTKPSGRTVRLSGKANKVGYYYRPADDFIADEPGIYIVDLSVTFDGITSAGQVTQPFPRGDVLGTTNGRMAIPISASALASTRGVLIHAYTKWPT